MHFSPQHFNSSRHGGYKNLCVFLYHFQDRIIFKALNLLTYSWYAYVTVGYRISHGHDDNGMPVNMLMNVSFIFQI